MTAPTTALAHIDYANITTSEGLAPGWHDQLLAADLTPGVLDSNAAHYFTSGQCHALAAAVALRTGGDMLLVRRPCGTCDTCEGYDCGDHDGEGPVDWCDGCEPSENCGTTFVEHVVAVLPDGRLVDADGFFDDEAELRERWGSLESADNPSWLEERGYSDNIEDLETVRNADIAATLADLEANEGFTHALLDVAESFVDAALENHDDEPPAGRLRLG